MAENVRPETTSDPSEAVYPDAELNPGTSDGNVTVTGVCNGNAFLRFQAHQSCVIVTRTPLGRQNGSKLFSLSTTPCMLAFGLLTSNL